MLNQYTEEFPHAIVVHISGMLMLEHLKEAEEVWYEQLDKQPDILAFDFKDVTGIDSISMNHIFKLTKMASEKEVKLILFDVNDELKKVFEIVKLDKVVTMMTGKRLYDEYIK
jgi:anti-anti-sigma factor